MKLFVKKIVVIVSVLSMIISLIPMFTVKSEAATSLNEEQFATKIVALKKEYPHGSTYKNNSSSTLGIECFGYANYLAKHIYGSFPTADMSAYNKNANWSITYGASAIDNLHVGDIVRFGYHSIFITKIDGEKVYYTDANADGKNSVRWGVSTWEKRELTKSELKKLVAKNLSSGPSSFDGKQYTGWVAHYKYWSDAHTLSVKYNANGGSIPTPVFVGDEYKVNHASGVNIRSGPGASYTRLGGYSNNESFTVVEYRQDSAYTWGWGKINYNGQDGWVALDSGWITKVGSVYSPDYYISSSLIYKKSTNTLVQKTMTYGKQDPNGLHDDTTFGLYRDGYTFLGWSLSASGDTVIPKDKVFTPESIVPELSNGSKTVTVYAVWEANTPIVVDKTVESIAISSIPAKSIYYVGESSNQSGISIIAKHTDGSYSKITEGFTCSPSVFTSEGTQTVTVNYSGKTATYSVQVTKVKEQVNNATAKVNSVGHHSPSLTSNMLPAGAYANDKIQVFCKNGDFYLCLIPWGADTTTISCGALMYIDVADVTLKSAVPDAAEFFTMNPTQTNNAVANTATKLYWKANLKAITYNDNEIAPKNIAAGTAVKVLFEINGNYCVESGGYIGFADKSDFTLNSIERGLQLNETEIEAIYGETISTDGLTVEKVMSDGTAIATSNYFIDLPTTTSIGTKYALVASDNFSDFIKVNVIHPTIKVVNFPRKNAYYLGETFDETGLKVVSVGTNGNETDITSQISLSYDFSEVGNKSVTISYAGAKAYVPVLVYSQPVIEIPDVMGYQGQTVTLPIYYYNTCDYTFPTSFKIELSYDNTKLEYVSANIPSLTQNGQMIVNSNTQGRLIVTCADEYAINDADIMLNIKFSIRSLDSSSEDTASVAITKIELYDGSGKKFESEVTNGQVCTCGKFLMSYYSNGELFDSYYKNYGESVSIIETIPTKNGYTFLGWSSSSESLIPEYYAKDTLECYENMALYAVWRINQYAVKYDENGGSGTMVGNIVEHGDSFKLDNCTFEAPAGKRFKAWAIGSLGGEQKQPGEQINITAETYVYAIWEDIPHTCVGMLQSGQGATCTVNGWNDYYQCSCGKFYTEATCINEITDLASWKEGTGKIAASHNYGMTWQYKDATGHAHVCTANNCGAYDTIQAHSPNIPAATEEQAQICTDCGYEMEAMLNHTHNPATDWTYNDTNHWHGCTGCEGQELDKAAHNDADNNSKCDACGYQMTTKNPDQPDTPDDTNTEKSSETVTPEQPNDNTGSNESVSDSSETGGRGGMIGGASAIIILLVGISVCFIFKKKSR